MNKLLIFSFLLLSACATHSTYYQGCYDGLSTMYFNLPTENQEKLKNAICKSLEDENYEKAQNLQTYPKGR